MSPEDKWKEYLKYLISWAVFHNDLEYLGESPSRYEDFDPYTWEEELDRIWDEKPILN